ncbi:MAG: leucine-rich repeat domain-containing protein, partial [Bacteroidales bacterium]|nr:leucine-rich repeat domain-containing protein [Bacteroidales bacterium]
MEIDEQGGNTMKKMSRSLLSLCLVLALCLGLFPTFARAEEEAPETGEPVEEAAAPAEPAADAQPEEQTPAAQAEETVDAASAAQPNAGGEPIADADFNDGKMHYTISADGVLTITGEGTMPDWSDSVHAPWYAFRSQVNSITVGEGITGLGAYAFAEMSSAKTVTLPDTLTALGTYCFYKSGIQAINLPEGITAIPECAFYNCSALTEIDLPEGITEILEYAFYYCSALTKIDLPDSMRTFGSYAFGFCEKLQSIVIPEGVTELKTSCLFIYCYALQEITLPSTLEKLGGSGMFSGAAISNIYFNGTLEQWLNISFNWSSYDTNLPMCKSCNLYINGQKLTSMTVPDGVKAIPDYAFMNVNLISVQLPASVTTVGIRAFNNCDLLKSV